MNYYFSHTSLSLRSSPSTEQARRMGQKGFGVTFKSVTLKMKCVCVTLKCSPYPPPPGIYKSTHCTAFISLHGILRNDISNIIADMKTLCRLKDNFAKQRGGRTGLCLGCTLSSPIQGSPVLPYKPKEIFTPLF